jgi:hypothetical protein
MLTYNNLKKKLKGKNIHMIIGNGTNNQFGDIIKLKKIIKFILNQLPDNSVFLYFGDISDKKNPDIGYVFQLVNLFRPDIDIYMIQINEVKNLGFPPFVTDVYWHNDYTKKCMWGGLNEYGEPCSNTKKWVNIHNSLGINKIFILGGGKITLQEFEIIKQLKIDYLYFSIERKYKGDGKTKIKSTDPYSTRIGTTYKKIKNSYDNMRMLHDYRLGGKL